MTMANTTGGQSAEMTIVQIDAAELDAVTKLYETVTLHLRQNGIDQWDQYYPTEQLYEADLRNGHLYGIRRGQEWIGVVSINGEQSEQFGGLPWRDTSGRPLVIHRLAVHPDCQGQGIGKRLLRFAEAAAVERSFTSIRFDAYSANAAAMTMYERAGYKAVGETRYPLRKHHFCAFEKLVSELRL